MIKDLFNANFARFSDEVWDYFDFMRSTDITPWTDTAIVGAGTALAALGSVKGGWARSISAAADTNGRNIQLAGGAAAPALICEATKNIKWASRIQMNQAALGQWLAGMALINTTTIFATTAADFIGFRKATAGTAIVGVLRQGGNELTVTLDLAFAASTPITLGFEVNKTSDSSNAGEVIFWASSTVGGTLLPQGKIATNATVAIPANTRFLTPSYEFIAAGGSGALSFDIDAVAYGCRR